MTPTTRAASRLTGAIAEHGEGPVWVEHSGQLVMVDMLAGYILTINAGGTTIGRRHVGPIAAALRPRRDGGFVVALERGFALLNDHDELSLFPELWSNSMVRMNDGACDARGRMYCGTMAYDAEPGRGALYRLERDGSTTTVLEGLTISNGLWFSADGKTAVLVDSPSQQVRRYALPDDDGPWSHYEVLAEIREADGTPDGICVDAQGGVWVALWSGSAVHRYTAEGVLTDVVTLPVSQVTACALGGDDGRTLYITTSALGVDRDVEPDAGAVFVTKVAVAGDPVLLADY